MLDAMLVCKYMAFSHIRGVYQASKQSIKQANKQANKETDFTVGLIWWGLLRFAPIM